MRATMKSLSGATKKMFENWGRAGGEKRKKNLSPGRRAFIATQAAHARWGRGELSFSMPSVRLDQARWEDPVYLEEILEEGELEDWRVLYRHVAEHPFGEIAGALEKVVRSVEIYGATNLWRGLLNNLRGGMG